MVTLLLASSFAADLDATTTSPYTEQSAALFVADPLAITRYGFGRPAVTWDATAGEAVMLFETYLWSGDGYTGITDFSACEATVGIYALGRATSPDGLTWTVSETPGLLPVPGTWYGCGIAQPTIVQSGGTWHLFFKAVDTTGPTGIGHATSTDGTNWTFDAAPILTPSQLSGNILEFGNPTVVRNDDGWLLLAERVLNGQAATPFQINVMGARSTDGVTWTPIDDDLDGEPDSVLLPTTDPWGVDAVGQPALVCEDAVGGPLFRMTLSGADLGPFPETYAMGLTGATSLDGTHWNLVEGGPYYVWDLYDNASYELIWWAWNQYRVGSADVVYFNTWEYGGEVAVMRVGSSDPTWSWDLATMNTGVCTGGVGSGRADELETYDVEVLAADVPCASPAGCGAPEGASRCAALALPLLFLRRRRSAVQGGAHALREVL